MERFLAQPLVRQLWIANVLVCLPVVALVLWSSRATLKERQSDLLKQTQFIATATAAYVNHDLETFDDMAAPLIADPAIKRLSQPEATLRLQEALLVRPSLRAIVLSDESGYEVARAGERIEVGQWHADVLQRGSRIVAAGPGHSGASRSVVVAYPIAAADEGRSGTVALYAELATLDEVFSTLDLPPAAIVGITDETGQVLARGGLLADELLADRRGNGATLAPPRLIVGPDGIERQHVDAPVAAGPFVVHIGIPSAVALNRTLPVWRRNLAVLAIGLTGWFLIVWYSARRFGDSVFHLDAAAQRIAAGDFSPIEHRPMPSAELADLQTAFDHMLRQFNTTRSALDAQMAEERRIRKELETLQGQVIRQERLAAVGQLVSGVAHEINNPLQAILGFAELLQMQSDVPESVKADLSLIQKESARACAIIRNLALFARQQPTEAAPVLLTDVVRAVAELRQRRLQTENIELRFEDTASLPVTAALAELQQVVLNFVVNAEQAILLSGRLPGRITIRTFDRDGAVVLEVEDTGPGIPHENEAKLFQPFFTTKPVGQGTGLGLSISYGIVDSLGGSIGYRRAPAGGAVFYIELPAADVSEVGTVASLKH